MTTVATDGVSMAADGMVSCGNNIMDLAFPKVHRVEGAIVGMAGSVYNTEAFLEWWRAGKPVDSKPDLSEDFEALVLVSPGEVWSYNHKCQRSREPAVTAIGNGLSYALGAMDAGASPHRAVEIAAGREHSTGGVITILSLENL